MAKQNNELLLKNHQSHTIRSMSLLETNATSIQAPRHWLGHGHEQGQGHNHGHGKYNSWYHGGYSHY